VKALFVARLFCRKTIVRGKQNFQNPFSSFRKRNVNFVEKLILKIAAEFLWQLKTETKLKKSILFGCFENSKLFGLKTLRIKTERKSGKIWRSFA
jgi:hypothetical protein